MTVCDLRCDWCVIDCLLYWLLQFYSYNRRHYVDTIDLKHWTCHVLATRPIGGHTPWNHADSRLGVALVATMPRVGHTFESFSSGTLIIVPQWRA